MPYRHSETRRKEDLEGFASDRRWPNLVLPLKRWVKEGSYDHMQTAVLLSPVRPGQAVALYEGNMFSGIDVTTANKFEYPNADACLDDGWEVD